MEAEYDCLSNNGNGTPTRWLQSTLSDLEENTKSMLSLIKVEEGDSPQARAETYYKKKPELEKQIEQFQKLYHLLLDQYTPVLTRFSVSSISTSMQMENTLGSFPKSLNIDSSNSNPEPCLEDVDSESQLKNIKNMTKTSAKTLEEKPSILNKHYKRFSFCAGAKPSKNESSNSDIRLAVGDIDPEILEKNISKLSETSQKRSGEGFIERWIDFEKRISSSEEILELVEDNRMHMDELMRRYEERNRVNGRLKEQIEVLLRENQLLHDENLILMSENKSLVKAIEDRVKEERRYKCCSCCFGAGVMKHSMSWLKALFKKP